MLKKERLKALIKERGRTRDWVASQARVQPDTLSLYLSGKRDPSPPVVCLLAQALEVPESEIWDETTKPDRKAG